MSGPVASEPSAPQTVAQTMAPTLVPDETPAPPAAAGSDVLRGDDAVAVVSELADRRARALTAADPGGLDLVDVPGSAARTADEVVIEELRASGAVYEALAFDVRAVREVSRDGEDGWVLEADVVTAEHVVVGSSGTRRSVAASEPRTSRLTLTRVEGEWRVTAVG